MCPIVAQCVPMPAWLHRSCAQMQRLNRDNIRVADIGEARVITRHPSSVAGRAIISQQRKHPLAQRNSYQLPAGVTVPPLITINDCHRWQLTRAEYYAYVYDTAVWRAWQQINGDAIFYSCDVAGRTKCKSTSHSGRHATTAANNTDQPTIQNGAHAQRYDSCNAIRDHHE